MSEPCGHAFCAKYPHLTQQRHELEAESIPAEVSLRDELASLRTRLSAAEGDRDRLRKWLDEAHAVGVNDILRGAENTADQRARADAAEARAAETGKLLDEAIEANRGMHRSIGILEADLDGKLGTIVSLRRSLRKLHDVAEGGCKAGLGFTEAMASALVDARRALATPSPEGKP